MLLEYHILHGRNQQLVKALITYMKVSLVLCNMLNVQSIVTVCIMCTFSSINHTSYTRNIVRLIYIPGRLLIFRLSSNG